MDLFLSPYNENTVISKEYTGPLDLDITVVDCISIIKYSGFLSLKECKQMDK